MVATIREEGPQRSRAMDLESYVTDVLGARLTLSEDMKRAQAWAMAENGDIGAFASGRAPGRRVPAGRVPSPGLTAECALRRRR